MNARARLTFDRRYYEAKYDDWLKHRAKWRKHAVPFSCLLILFGLGLCYGYRDQWMFGGFVVVTGCFELIISLTYKRRWVHRCLQASCTDKIVEIEFENELMNSTSRNGTSSIKISALDSIAPASNGIFLIQDNQTSIYIPRSSVDPPDAYPRLIQYLTIVASRDSPKHNTLD